MKYNIPKKHYIKYLQLKSFIKVIKVKYCNLEKLPPLFTIERFSIQNCLGKGLVNKLNYIKLKQHNDNTESKDKDGCRILKRISQKEREML